jgi:hypothetical protein
MALTSTRIENGLIEDKWGKAKVMGRRVTFDSAYPTGGEPIAASSFGMRQIHTILFNDASGYVLGFDRVNQKVKVYVEEAVAAGGPLVEVSDGANLSSLSVDMIAIGWG